MLICNISWMCEIWIWSYICHICGDISFIPLKFLFQTINLITTRKVGFEFISILWMKKIISTFNVFHRSNIFQKYPHYRYVFILYLIVLYWIVFLCLQINTPYQFRYKIMKLMFSFTDSNRTGSLSEKYLKKMKILRLDQLEKHNSIFKI